MPDMDEILQEKLEAIEKGTPTEEVIHSLPAEAQELAALIRLASAVRTLPHPELNLAQSHVGRQKVLAAAQARTRPLPRRQAAPRGLPGWAILPGLAGLAMVFIGVVALVAALGLWLAGPPGAKAARLMDISGYVELQAPSGEWVVAQEGDLVRAGQHVRTLGASGATLLFYEGSRSAIGPNAEVTLKTLGGSWGKGLQVELAQQTGRTTHSVTPLRGKKSLYRVDTPGGTANVHGTTFSVAVGNDGQSLFSVRNGKVEVANADSRVFVTSGQATTSGPGEGIEAPAYLFALSGTLTSMDGDVWSVEQVPFVVTPETLVTGLPMIGDDVRVEGRILENGQRLADSIERAEVAEPSASFTGPVQAIGDDSWQVGGNTVLTGPQTLIGEGIATGDAVRVTFAVDGQNWLALSIESLQEPAPEEAPTLTPSPIPGAKPALEFSPEEIEISSCAASFSFSGNLVNQGEEQDDLASNVQMSYTIDMGAGLVQEVLLNPAGWDSLAQGESAPFSVDVVLDPSAWNTAAEKKVVKVRVFVAHESNRPDHLKSRMTITIDGSECPNEQTPQPEESDTPTPAPDEQTPTPGTVEQLCTGADPHPTGARLAQRYNVDYAVIMHWFCDYRFGFGEIDTAYSLSLQTGLPVEEIFQMRLDGMGWGQIKQTLIEKKNPPGKEGQPKTKPTQKPKPTRKP